MYTVKISRNPGDEAKEVHLDSSLRGSASPSRTPNFSDLVKLYHIKDEKKYRVKADVINVNDFLDYVRVHYQLGEDFPRTIRQRHLLGKLTEGSDFLVCFWDRPSELHHRDIMRFLFGEVLEEMGEYERRVRQHGSKPFISRGYDCNPDGIANAQLDLISALEELAESKVSASTELGEMAKRIIRCSQGYVLGSEGKESASDLWRSRLYSLKLESKITKDQRELDIMPAPEEIFRNIRTLLSAIQGVELRTNRFIVPSSHTIPVADLEARSYWSTREFKSFSKPTPVLLRVHYESPNGVCLDC
jgi:hypothetical protein